MSSRVARAVHVGNSKKSRVPIKQQLSDAVERGDLPTLKLLLPQCGIVGYSCQLLLLAMRRKRTNNHRELLKLLIDHGAKLDASDDNYSSFFDYVFRDLRKSKTLDFTTEGYADRGRRQREDVTAIAALPDDLKLLVGRGGADITLPRVMDNQNFLGELQWTVRRAGSCGCALLRFFLEQGLDPNFQSMSFLTSSSLLVDCLRRRNFGAASLLIEYGAWQSGPIVFDYLREGDRVEWLTSGIYPSMKVYFDSIKDADNKPVSELIAAKQKLIKRRQETYPSLVIPALATVYPSSFDPAPIAAIISEYVI